MDNWPIEVIIDSCVCPYRYDDIDGPKCQARASTECCYDKCPNALFVKENK